MTNGINGDNPNITSSTLYSTGKGSWIESQEENLDNKSIFENLFDSEDVNFTNFVEENDYSEYEELMNADYTSQISDLSSLDEDFISLLDDMGFSAVKDGQGNENQGLYSMTDDNGVTQYVRAVQNNDGETKIIYNDGSGNGAAAFDFQEIDNGESNIVESDVDSANNVNVDVVPLPRAGIT